MSTLRPSSVTAPPANGLAHRLARLKSYFGHQPAAWIVAFLGTLLGAATEPAIPALLQPLLDNGFTQGTMPLWWVPVGILGVFTVRGIAQFSSQYALTRIANDGMLRLRRDLFAHLLRADLSVFRQQSASALSNTVVFEVQNGCSQLVSAAVGLSRDGFTLVALLGYLFYTNWQLTLIVGIVVPGVTTVMRKLSKRLYAITKASQKATDELAYVVEENALAHRMVRLHAAQAHQQARFAKLSETLRRLAIKSTIASSAMTPLTQLLSAAALSVVICVALWQSRDPGHASVTVGGFAAFLSAMMMLVAPMRRLADLANPVTRGLAALERGLNLIDHVPAESSGAYQGAPGHEKTPPSSPSEVTEVTEVSGTAGTTQGLVLNHVSVRYKDDEPPALNDVSLQIPTGQVVALVGPSGSGKTTLANLLPRFVPLSGGSISLNGVNLQDWSLLALREQFAMVSQDVVMLNDSLAHNVAMGHPLGASLDEARVLACLEAANLSDFLSKQPEGIHAQVGHNAQQLSGGQRQRLAIARALYKNAPYLILDEATSALDNESERLVQDALDRVMKGRTTLVIAHRLSTIEHADRVVVMAEGKIVEQGSHAELLAEGGLYARLHAQGMGS
jgi:subfamily B ATP-binding cassette protein MsbA